MAPRTYRQYCAAARALDVVGDRWTLLVVRELLDGPKRYTDLQGGLPGIATDVLATRLAHLESAGLVTHRTLEPPAARRVYELTPRGREVEPIVLELARFGQALLGPRRPDEAVDVRWLALALRALMGDRRPTSPLTVRFETPDGTTTLVLSADGVEPSTSDEADVVLRGPIDALAEALDPATASALVASGDLEVIGARQSVRALAGLLAGGASSGGSTRSP